MGELANDNEARAIKGRSGKLGKRAGKVNILTRGDLSSDTDYQSNPDSDVRLRRQESAEVIVTIVEVGRAEHQEDE